MQLAKSNFIEKILRDADGRLVRATFCVYENGGRIKARLVSTVFLEENLSENKILFLNGQVATPEISSEVSNSHSITSPYFDSRLLHISGSKPRAPTQ